MRVNVSPGQQEHARCVIGTVTSAPHARSGTRATCTPQNLVATGILVLSGGTPVTTTIAFSRISNHRVGIWLSKAVAASGLFTNSFANVTIPILSGQ